VQTVVLYKATVIAEIAVMALQESSLDLIGIVDEKGVGSKFLHYRVLPMDVLRQIDYDRLIITSEDSFEKVAEHLRRYEVDEKKICSF